MEKYEAASKEAAKNITVADHVLNVTYPLVQDAKMLKFVLHKVYNSVEKSMAALLYYDRFYKEVPPFNESFAGMYPHLKHSLRRHGLSQGYLNFIMKLKEITEKQKESDVEFIRKNKFVFASRDYNLSTISEKEIKDYLAKARFFMKEVVGVMNGDERITKRR